MYHYSLSEWLLFFYTYSFLGWIWESCYVSFKHKKWVNRGFMHGPFLPIYGWGAIMVLFVTIPVKEDLRMVFICGMIGATCLEYVTGMLMEILFHVHYWDYSDRLFNLKGYICLSSSIAWGFCSILIIKVLHHPIEFIMAGFNPFIKELLTLGITSIVMIDLTQSFNEAMHLREMLMQLSRTNLEIQMLRKYLDTMIASVDTDTARLREKLLQTKEEIEIKFMEEKQKCEEVLHTQLERSRENKNRRKQEMENYLECITRRKKLALQNLLEKASSYLEQIEIYTQSIHSTNEISKLKVEIEELREKVRKQKEEGILFRQRDYIHFMGILRRNPNTISRKYEEALKEIKELNHKEK